MLQRVEYSGFPFPMLQRGTQGPLAYVHQDTERLVRDSILQILLTNKGERPWNPEFGCDIQKFLFETAGNIDSDTLATLAYEAVKRWERRAKVNIGDFIVYPSMTGEGLIQLEVNYLIVGSTVPTFGSITITL